MSKVLIALMLMATPIFSQAFIRIGNNGEGVLINGKVYLLDLYEAQNHLQPYMDSSSDKKTELGRSLGVLQARFPSEMALFTRKIIDIEQKVPGLGYAILESLKSYSLDFSDESSIFQDPTTRNIVVAVRRSETIYIWKQQWKKMDTTNRVALLVHEGIYSLAKVQCRNLFDCFQSSPKIRPIVGALFNKNLEASDIQKIKEELGLAPLFGICKKINFESSYSVSGKSSVCPEGVCEKLEERTNVSGDDSSENNDRLWICRKASDLHAQGLSLRVEYNFKYRGINILNEYYSIAKEGTFQHSTFAVDSEINDKGGFDYIDEQSCKDTLFSHRNSLSLLSFSGPFYPNSCR